MAKRKTVKELKEAGLKLRHYGLKLRALPNRVQKEKIHHFCGASRFSFNLYLAERNEVYQAAKETLTVAQFKKSFNLLKQHPMFSWLKEADKFALGSGIEAVEDAFKRFFKGQTKFPKFKSKHNAKQSYTTKFTNNNIELAVESQMVKLPKLGWMKVRLSKRHRQMYREKGFSAKIKSVTVTYHSSGQYYVSLTCEDVIKMEEEIDWSAVSLDQIIALDVGITHFYIDSNGNKVDNPKHLKEKLKKLASLQRRLKNKKIGSSNFKKLQQKISRLHIHISNKRKDFLHKESRKLVNENQVIVLEDLNVKGMIRNKKLARSIADVSWSMFKVFVSYKAEWANKKVILIDRFFPSLKKCSSCHEKNTLLSLSDREWVCPNCGAVHDRDMNAAKNIKKEGLRILELLPVLN